MRVARRRARDARRRRRRAQPAGHVGGAPARRRGRHVGVRSVGGGAAAFVPRRAPRDRRRGRAVRAQGGRPDGARRIAIQGGQVPPRRPPRRRRRRARVAREGASRGDARAGRGARSAWERAGRHGLGLGGRQIQRQDQASRAPRGGRGSASSAGGERDGTRETETETRAASGDPGPCRAPRRAGVERLERRGGRELENQQEHGRDPRRGGVARREAKSRRRGARRRRSALRRAKSDGVYRV
mmetsp:Transcript_10828/g.46108  ORF Transcript_10828/g.46108 Transcript_10828/m.46108 type:complete len:242 (+) Transcript_10828:140-865(+)